MMVGHLGELNALYKWFAMSSGFAFEAGFSFGKALRRILESVLPGTEHNNRTPKCSQSDFKASARLKTPAFAAE